MPARAMGHVHSVHVSVLIFRSHRGRRWPLGLARRLAVLLVVIAARSHPIPSRTRKLSSPAPMVLYGRPWESRTPPALCPLREEGAFYLGLQQVLGSKSSPWAPRRLCTCTCPACPGNGSWRSVLWPADGSSSGGEPPSVVSEVRAEERRDSPPVAEPSRARPRLWGMRGATTRARRRRCLG